MEKELVEKIKANPDYQKLVQTRNGFAVKLTIAMLVVYFAFILTIAFDPAVLGAPLGADTVTTIGIPIGIAIIVFAFILTGIYTKRANSEFDDLANAVKKSVGED
ncbi:DUF485 domain-containing protein [Sulfurimonas lithotrophica]|uniref:DUF485 domain-containing protein n=1 Tax=Sulfurimonas lithotrophica TaxID=2590022 RepID=A0A5P8NZZ1_9BACT|nr:DUF485 domain-containing protein [Sulfurimonas lithotrophica]QFR48920.1 DUF485 domain-containing protein [Sulfurimonas lithotrophica]